MANSFSPAISINLEEFDIQITAHSLSAPMTFSVLDKSYYMSLGPLYSFESIAAVLSFGPTLYVDALDFILGGVQLLTMGAEIIHRSESSEIQVSELILTDKNGTGPSVISSPSGTAYQFRGSRLAIENNTESFSIPQHKSGYVWTNTGANTAITGVLPTGALAGTSAYFVRTGSDIYVDPGADARIFIPESGSFRMAGEMAHLSSVGARMAIVSDGNDNWYPIIELGTIE